MITCGLELVVDCVNHHMLYSGVELITKAKTQTDQLLIIMILIMTWPLHWVAVLEGYGLYCHVGFRVTEKYIHLRYSDFVPVSPIFKTHMENIT